MADIYSFGMCALEVRKEGPRGKGGREGGREGWREGEREGQGVKYNTQMVAVALGPWASHSEDRAEP